MNRRYRRIALLLILLMLLFGVARRNGRLRAALQPDSTPAGTLSVSMEFGGLTRAYLVHVPPSYNAVHPVPLVFVLHGAMESITNVEQLSGMSAKADEKNFIAVYPRGTGRAPTWNASNCCGPAVKNHIDDIGFFRALIEKLSHDYAVDPRRIYFTGISNGGMMSYRVAWEMSDQVAAIAPVEGALNVECHPASAVSVIIFHGTADRLVPFNGGSTPFQIGNKRTDNSVAGAVDFWVKHNGCATQPQHEETAEVHIDKYTGCRAGSAVTLEAIQGGHHMWPGHRFSGNDVPATDLIWAFFAAHPKPSL